MKSRSIKAIYTTWFFDADQSESRKARDYASIRPQLANKLCAVPHVGTLIINSQHTLRHCF